jgi:hypothetical protein
MVLPSGSCKIICASVHYAPALHSAVTAPSLGLFFQES